MKSLVFVMCLSLTGCFYQTVNQFDIQRARSFCGGADKIVEIESTFLGGEAALCTNGKHGSLLDVSAE